MAAPSAPEGDSEPIPGDAQSSPDQGTPGSFGRLMPSPASNYGPGRPVLLGASPTCWPWPRWLTGAPASWQHHNAPRARRGSFYPATALIEK